MLSVLTRYFWHLIIYGNKNKGMYANNMPGGPVWRDFLHKSILGFRFWTFFLSIFEKRIYFCAKSAPIFGCEHYDANLSFPKKNV